MRLRNVVLLVTLLLGIISVVVVINQTAQVVSLADRVHPAFGAAVFWGLLALYGICVAVPITVFLRLPKPLAPPPSEASPAFHAHLAALSLRLRGNPLLSDRAVSGREDIEEALRMLDGHADEVVRQAGSRAFLGTAVSQNGSLDALIVLLAQTRMIWRIAHIYWQRPTPRDLVSLYANVATTTFLAGQIEDLDLSEQVQPLISAVIGSVGGVVPGLQAASTLLVTSVATGAANAFLVLRVGLLARMYCGALVLPETRTLRRLAAAQAAQMLGGIARAGAQRVAAAVWSAAASRAGDAAREFRDSVAQRITTIARGCGILADAPDAPKAGSQSEP